MSDSFWKKCTTCKKPILFRQVYWVCNVSTCNRKRTGLTFCSVDCWDAHVPVLRHKDSWAEERSAPSAEDWQKMLNGEAEPTRTRAPKPDATTISAPSEPKPQTVTTILRRRPG
jgi:hypothetical protein